MVQVRGAGGAVIKEQLCASGILHFCHAALGNGVGDNNANEVNNRMQPIAGCTRTCHNARAHELLKNKGTYIYIYTPSKRCTHCCRLSLWNWGCFPRRRVPRKSCSRCSRAPFCVGLNVCSNGKLFLNSADAMTCSSTISTCQLSGPYSNRERGGVSVHALQSARSQRSAATNPRIQLPPTPSSCASKRH